MGARSGVTVMAASVARGSVSEFATAWLASSDSTRPKPRDAARVDPGNGGAERFLESPL